MSGVLGFLRPRPRPKSKPETATMAIAIAKASYRICISAYDRVSTRYEIDSGRLSPLLLRLWGFLLRSSYQLDQTNNNGHHQNETTFRGRPSASSASLLRLYFIGGGDNFFRPRQFNSPAIRPVPRICLIKGDDGQNTSDLHHH